MEIRSIHDWPTSAQAAIQIQKELQPLVELKKPWTKLDRVRLIAGCDMSIDKENNMAFSGVMVFSFPDLEIVEQQATSFPLQFPYVPGLLSFREGPALLHALKMLRHRPDVIFLMVRALRTPRGLGIASHLGLFLDLPTIGCAKSKLYGKHDEPASDKGRWQILSSLEGAPIGAVVRTRKNVKPVYISPGHKIDIATSIDLALQCCDGYRIPKPTRLADQLVAKYKQEYKKKIKKSVYMVDP